MKLKVLPITLRKLRKLAFASSYVVDEFLEYHYVTGESFFTCFGLFVAWFSGVYKIKSILINICNWYYK